LAAVVTIHSPSSALKCGSEELGGRPLRLGLNRLAGHRSWQLPIIASFVPGRVMNGNRADTLQEAGASIVMAALCHLLPAHTSADESHSPPRSSTHAASPKEASPASIRASQYRCCLRYSWASARASTWRASSAGLRLRLGLLSGDGRNMAVNKTPGTITIAAQSPRNFAHAKGERRRSALPQAKSSGLFCPAMRAPRTKCHV